MKTLVRLCMLLVLILAACSPVKQVLKNPKYFQEVADSVVKRGYCINDTVVETKYVETITVKDSLIHDSSFVHDLQSVVDFDTTFPSGVRIKIHYGKVQVDCPQKTKTVVAHKTITQTVRDLKLESILRAENKVLTDSIQLKTLRGKEQQVQIGTLQNKVNALTFKIYLFALCVLLYIAYRVYSFFKPF